VTFESAIKERPEGTEYVFASIYFSSGRICAEAIYITRKKLLKIKRYIEMWQFWRKGESRLFEDCQIWKKEGLQDIDGITITKDGRVEIIQDDGMIKEKEDVVI
jgi:hypothetical protein